MGKQQPSSFKNYLPWVGILVVALLAFIVKTPQPELDWEGFVLPMTNRYASTKDSQTPLEGVTVVISGSTSGIGRGMVEAMVKLGATVIAMGRSQEKLEILQQVTLFAQGSLIRTVVADFNDLDSVSKAAEEINELAEGKIDILLNNAGIHEGIAVVGDDPVSAQGYDRIFSVNYLAHFLLTEKLAPSLKASKRPIVAQMSSSFHNLGDWTDLMPTNTGSDSDGLSPPPASQKGGTGGFVFRTQRGYANSKLALIFHARALKRRNPDLAQARIVSICPGWVATNIMPNPIGSAIINAVGFRRNGWGIASTLYGMFADDEESKDQDYFSNTRALNVVAINHKWPYAELTHHPWTFAFGMRDFGAFALAFVVLAVQKFMPIAEYGIPSPVTYNEDTQDQLYDWSKQAVAEWL